MDNIKQQTNIGFVAAWFATSATAILFSIIFILYLTTPQMVKPSYQNFNLYAALPENENSVSDSIVFEDGRAKIIEDFFRKYKAPLADFSRTFIAVADKYQLDWRLLPAISMQESNGGKRVITESYNPFGYGIYGSLVVRFNSWDESIERVGKALRNDYLNQGLKNPNQIMAKYTPPSLEKGGAWAKGVSSFMEELR